MGYEGLLKYLEKDLEEQKEKILSKAKREIDEINKDAEKEIEKRKSEALAKVKGELSILRTRKVYEAKKEAEKPVFEAKLKAVEKVFEVLSEKVKKIRERSDYSKIFEKLLIEALDDCEGKLNVKVSKGDRKIAEKILKEKGFEYEISETDEFVAGVEIVFLDGKKRVKNTIEARLKRAEPFLKSEAAKLLFGG